MLSPSQFFRISLGRREESFSISKAPASPPLPPLRKGGKGIACSQRHSIAPSKNTRRPFGAGLLTPPLLRPTVSLFGPGPRLPGRLAVLPAGGVRRPAPNTTSALLISSSRHSPLPTLTDY